jgi:hypothetical protein
MMHVQLVGSHLGAASVEDKVCFNWPAFPPGNLTRNDVMALQVALNSTSARVKVDGKLGRNTVIAVNTVLGTSFTSCDQVAPRIRDLTRAVVLRKTSTLPEVLTPPRPPRPGDVGPVAVPPPPTPTEKGISPYAIAAGGGALVLLGLGVMWYRRTH